MEELIASNVVRENTESYGKYVISHHFPSAYDGLKKVARRIIQSIKVDEKLGSDTLVSRARILHPHGPDAIYQTACRYEEPFSHAFPIFELEGKGSSYSGDKPSASRYTKMWLTEFAVDIFFKDIDFKTIATELGESLNVSEYQYLIPKIPTSLLYGTETIGFGYSSRSMPMKFEHVCELTIDYIRSNDRKSWNGSHLPHLMIPSLPVKIYITNQAELLDQYSKDNFDIPVETEGIYEILSPTDVLIKTMSYGASPLPLRIRLEQALKDRNHPLTKQFDVTPDDFSDDRNYADLQLTTKRGINIFLLIDKIKAALRVRGKFYPVRNYVINKTMVNLTPASLIKIWYEERYRSVLGTLKYKQQQLFRDKMRYEIYLIISEHIDEVIKKLRNSEEDEFVVWARKTFDLSPRQCEILLNTNLQMLLKSKRKDLEIKLAKILSDIEEVNDSFSKIDERIINDIQYLKGKYHTNEAFSSRPPSWIGCLIVGDFGTIQLRETDEIFHYGKMFHKQVTFIPYENVTQLSLSQKTYLLSEVPYTSAIPKVRIHGPTNWFMRSKVSKLTESPVFESSTHIFNSVSKDAWRISKEGTFSKSLAPERALYMFDASEDATLIVVSVNTGYPNTIRIQRLKMTDTLLLMPGGKNEILNVILDGIDSTLCNMPVGHRWKIIELTDIIKHLGKSNIADINFNRMQKV